MPVAQYPFTTFNFTLYMGTGAGMGAAGGFQEADGLTHKTVAEFRLPNSQEGAPDKVHGIQKASDITLKRGLIAAGDLYDWLQQVRDSGPTQFRTVTIQLLNEAHTQPVCTWKLNRARPIRYHGPALTSNGADVAIEEMVLVSESIEIVT